LDQRNPIFLENTSTKINSRQLLIQIDVKIGRDLKSVMIGLLCSILLYMGPTGGIALVQQGKWLTLSLSLSLSLSTSVSLSISFSLSFSFSSLRAYKTQILYILRKRNPTIHLPSFSFFPGNGIQQFPHFMFCMYENKPLLER
jgi:hypothetical protein